MASETPPQSRKRTTSGTDDEDSERSRFRLHTTIESQAARIERLMARVDKPIVLPERKEKTVKAPRDFVRNIQGSSAGAGSGEFHVYRALRRKEYERQKVLTEKGKEEEEQRLYHERLEQQKKEDAERTAKKREKRKKRQKNQNGKDKKQKMAETSVDGDGAPAKQDAEPTATGDKAAEVKGEAEKESSDSEEN